MKQLHDLEERPDYVWGGTVDNNKYLAVVSRTGPHTGVLSVYQQSDDHLVHTVTVGLSYDAIFGPDAADVAEWQSLTIETVDRYERGTLA
jgi:hypothetical protein